MTPDLPPFTRRAVLATAGAATAVVALTELGGRASAAPRPKRWSGSRSANGWSVVADCPEHAVEGSDLTVRLRDGAAATVLLHCLRRYLYEIDDTVRAAELRGHGTDRTITSDLLSNHLSGTALAIRPGWYPAGGAERMWRSDVVVLRDILADCEGVVAWGGDADPAVESYLGLAVPPGDARLVSLAARIRGWQDQPDAGAGTFVDPFAARRRERARALAVRQRGRV